MDRKVTPALPEKDKTIEEEKKSKQAAPQETQKEKGFDLARFFKEAKLNVRITNLLLGYELTEQKKSGSKTAALNRGIAALECGS